MSQRLPRFIKPLLNPSFKLIPNISFTHPTNYLVNRISSKVVSCPMFLCQHDNFLHTCSRRLTSNNSNSEAEKLNAFSSQMSMRLLNENSFLSWCRNAYLSTVVGIAMMEQASSSLAQVSGFGAFLIGGMNLFWGTGCHITNLIRLRQVSGMSSINLTLNVMGSLIHCLLFSVILIFYIGFLEERSQLEAVQSIKKTVGQEMGDI